jgi:hypothetical protein
MTHDKKSRAGKQLRQAAARSQKLRRIPANELEPIIRGAVDPIDEMIMRPLRDMLRGIGDAPVSALLERKLIPHKVSSALINAELLSLWLVLARAVQTVTGVPASILIAEIWFGPHEYSERSIPSNDLFNCGKSFPSLGAALLDHAIYLGSHPGFEEVMRAKDNPDKYVEAIAACTLWKKYQSKDRADTIIEGRLVECDALPIEQIFSEHGSHRAA